MPDAAGRTRNLSFTVDLDARARQAIERAAQSLDDRQARADANRRREVERLRDGLDRRLRDLFGRKGLAELRAATGRERQARLASGRLPVDDRPDVRAARRAANRRMADLGRRLGVSPDQLRQIIDEHDAKLFNVLSTSDGPVSQGYRTADHLDRWLELSPLHAAHLPWGGIPQPGDITDPHRWFLFRPPFFGFLFWFWYQGSDDFRAERDLILEPATAWVGNRIHVACTDAGFGEQAQARADAQIAFAFVPPVTGILEVAVDAQCLSGTYELSIRDNFGFSAASGHQYNYLSISLLNPSGPEEQFVEMDRSQASSDGDDLTVHSNNLSRLQHYFADVVSASPVKAGETVVIAVGTRSLDMATASRMDVQSDSDFEWFLSSVTVRVVP